LPPIEPKGDIVLAPAIEPNGDAVLPPLIETKGEGDAVLDDSFAKPDGPVAEAPNGVILGMLLEAEGDCEPHGVCL
jgi:hypothetical protein